MYEEIHRLRSVVFPTFGAKPLRRLKNSGLIVGNIPSNDEDARNLALLLHEQLKDQAKYGPSNPTLEIDSGRQDLILKLNPNVLLDSNHDRILKTFLTGPEWSAIFYDVLGSTGSEPFVIGENINEWMGTHRREFQPAIPAYPMLAKIWNTYANVSYQAEEIERLKNECVKVRESTSNSLAKIGLRKLIDACDEAFKLKMGLWLAPD